MNKKLIFGICAAVLVVVLAVVGVFYWTSSLNSVAKVGDQKISEAEYKFYLGNVKSQMEQTVTNSGGDIATFWSTKIEGKDAKEVVKTKAIEEAQKVKIQLAGAKEAGQKLDKTEEDKIIKSLEEQVTQAGGKVEVDKQLKQLYGITLSEYKSIILELNLVSKYTSEEQKKIQVTEEDYQKAYKDIENADKVTVRHILITTLDAEKKPLPQDKLDEAKKKADDILAKVVANGNMKDLAAQYSQDPGSKDIAGQYSISKGEMVKEFEDWAFKAKPGDTGIVKTEYGYHIMKKPKFEEIKDSLKDEIAASKYMSSLELLMKDAKYAITKNQKLYDSILVQ